MKKIHRIAAILLAALVLFTMIASLFTVVHNAGHVCEGDHCPVCKITEVCLRALRALRDVFVPALVLFLCVSSAICFTPRPVNRAPVGTPVSLKVKLTN